MGYKKKHHECTKGQGRRRGRRDGAGATTQPSSMQVSVRPLVINEKTRWKPHRLVANCIEESDEARDARLLLVLLNKLTPQNFHSLVDSFISKTTIHFSHERMKDAIDEIVQRASLDMRYTQTFAKLCQRLAANLPKNKTTNNAETWIDFHSTLLEYCRDNVNRTLTTDSSSSTQSLREQDLFEHPDERRVRLAFARQQMVGSKRFIGELFNNDTIDLSDVLTFVEILLNHTTMSQLEQENGVGELSLECLCVLLDSCGKTLDGTAKEAPEMQRCWKALEEMTTCEISTELMSIRMKCLILDLLELRASEWNPKRYSCRQRKEQLVAKPLERDTDVSVGSAALKPRREGKRKGKSVRFVTK